MVIQHNKIIEKLLFYKIRKKVKKTRGKKNKENLNREILQDHLNTMIVIQMKC